MPTDPHLSPAGLGVLAALIFAAAVLYSSIGHAGASGYLAAMAFVGLAPASMRPTALVLNVVVASLATVGYARTGPFPWSTLGPLALGSVPLAAVGGALHLPGNVYRPLVGAILLLTALSLLRRERGEPEEQEKNPPAVVALLCGGAIGLLSGLTGVGGGIFLSPLLLATGWAAIRRSAALTSAFILVNSLAALAGNLSSTRALPAFLPWLVVAAIAGGLIGAELGSRRLPPRAMRALLCAILALAGSRLIAAA